MPEIIFARRTVLQAKHRALEKVTAVKRHLMNHLRHWIGWEDKMYYLNTTVETYWCHISKGYIDYHTYLSMDSILMYQSLGYDVTIVE